MTMDYKDDLNHDVTEFLLGNLDVTTLTAEVYPGDRFIAASKPFVIRAMTTDEFELWQRQCNKTRIVKGKRESDFNSKKFNDLVIINCTVNPNFKDAETLKRAGCTTPEQFLNKALLPGEANNLQNEISALSGFDKSLDENIESVKND
jgi:Phage XkdN-like tail assembly chaperone protein, TAC